MHINLLKEANLRQLHITRFPTTGRSGKAQLWKQRQDQWFLPP